MIIVPYIHKVKSVDKVIDGDTVDLTIDSGFRNYHSDRFRLDGYDAPEITSKNDIEKAAGLKVKEYVEGLLNRYVGTLYVMSKKVEIYGRWNGVLWLEKIKGKDSVNLNDMIIMYMVDNKLTKGG